MESSGIIIRRQEMRFEHFFTRGVFDSGAWNSLSSITDRLEKDWAETDEQGALTDVSAYNDLTAEISEAEASRASMDAKLLDEPLRTTKDQAEYRAARQAIYDEVHELDSRLSRLGP